MLSVDNFYWILHQNLIRPCGLDTWYYHPFGDTNTRLIFIDNSIKIPRRAYHVLFGFDQEPIWDNRLGTHYESLIPVWSNRIPKILANSEQSIAKNKLCQERAMMDWHYFYHGFAALDWFRDGRYTNNNQDIQDVFLSFNRLVRNQRAYRIDFFARLIEADILHQGSVSFHSDLDCCLKELEDSHTRISPIRRGQIDIALRSISGIKRQLNGSSITSAASAQLGAEEFAVWQRSFVHVVNETVFYEPKLHLTEKIFKPIVARRPFVLSAAPGNLAYLQSYGFQTFSQWWDEGYDSIIDPDKRLQAICEILIDLCARPMSEIKDMLADMQSILEHNHKHLYTTFRDRIVDELVNNFDVCIRTWNNGRVDNTILPVLPDLDRIKLLLSQ